MNDQPSDPPGAHRSRYRPILLLAALGLASAGLLAGLNQLTGQRIAEQRQAYALAEVSAMLDPGRYDNDLLDDTAVLHIRGLPRPAKVYRARSAGRPVAAVIDLSTERGYSGDIRLLVAIEMDGTVIGARVLEHRETPGLGDKIERSKSAWIEQFAGRSLGNPPAQDWAPDRRGGRFDTLSSATITSAAVVAAVRQAVEAFEQSKKDLFSNPP